MTTPAERTRSLLQAGAFLRELSKDRSVPLAMREEAGRLMRHYPTVSTLRLLASLDAAHDSNILEQNFDPTWFEDYRFHS
jgi:hypothetical protein